MSALSSTLNVYVNGVEQEAARDLQMRNKELSRRSHFRNTERQNQERKDIRIAVKEQRNEEYRSQVLP